MPSENRTMFADLLGKTSEELQTELKAAKDELFQLRFQLAIRQLENTGRIGEVKHRIAQIKTALRQQELKAQGA